MGKKWTAAQKEKFRETMAKKRLLLERPPHPTGNPHNLIPTMLRLIADELERRAG